MTELNYLFTAIKGFIVFPHPLTGFLSSGEKISHRLLTQVRPEKTRDNSHCLLLHCPPQAARPTPAPNGGTAAPDTAQRGRVLPGSAVEPSMCDTEPRGAAIHVSTPNRAHTWVSSRSDLISHSKHHNQTQKPREKILITNSGQVFFIISVGQVQPRSGTATLDSILILSVTVLQIKLYTQRNHTLGSAWCIILAEKFVYFTTLIGACSSQTPTAQH